MARLWSCPNGHCWHDERATNGRTVLACPVCAGPGAPVLAPAPGGMGGGPDAVEDTLQPLGAPVLPPCPEDEREGPTLQGPLPSPFFQPPADLPSLRAAFSPDTLHDVPAPR